MIELDTELENPKEENTSKGTRRVVSKESDTTQNQRRVSN